MKKVLPVMMSLVISGVLASPVSAFTVVQDGDAGNFAKNMPTPTFNILYEKVGISKAGAIFTKSSGSLFEARNGDANGYQIFGVQIPFSALPNHVNSLYTLNQGDNSISGSYSFLFPNSVRDNYGNYYDFRISESNIKIGSAETRGVSSIDYVTLLSVDRALVSRSTGGTYSAREGLGHRGDFTFTVEKNGVPVDGTFVFSARDLDIPDHVSEAVTYPNYAGPYSESFQDVNNTVSKVYLTDDTTVQVINGNRIVGSTSNNDATYRSGFAFLANSEQVAHMGVSGAATGVPIILERSFSSFEQTSGEGGTISAVSRGEEYDSTSGRLITIPSAADGSNSVVYTMTPEACHKAKKITLSIQDTGGNEAVTEIEVASLAENPVENLTFDEETGVLTYTYPNTSDSYRRYAIDVEWEETECSAGSVDPTDDSGQTNSVESEDVATESKGSAPNTGVASNTESSLSTTETYPWGGIVGALVLAAVGLRKNAKRNK